MLGGVATDPIAFLMDPEKLKEAALRALMKQARSTSFNGGEIGLGGDGVGADCLEGQTISAMVSATKSPKDNQYTF